MSTKSPMVALLLALAVVSPPLAADTKDDLVALEKSIWKAFANHDAKAYAATMTDDAMEVGSDGEVTTGEKLLASVSNPSCNVKSYDLADTRLRQLSPDIAVLTYRLTQDVTCDGKKSPTKTFATAIYVRQGGKWRWTMFQQTPIKE
jgi:uncharacterized protein (TIGR02246 family)